MATEPIPVSQRGRFSIKPVAYGKSEIGSPLNCWLPPRNLLSRRLVMAGIHGDESSTTRLLSAALRYINPKALRAAVILCANPDGISLGTRGNSNGVDLNRNFPTKDWRIGDIWHQWAEKGRQEVALSTGKRPLSEAETAALTKLIVKFKIDEIISMHTPLACIDDPLKTGTGKWLAKKTKLPLVGGVGYDTPGSLGTWGLENDTSVVTYELPDLNFQQYYQKHFPAIVELIL